MVVAMKPPLREFLCLMPHSQSSRLPQWRYLSFEAGSSYPRFPADMRPILLHGTGLAEEALKLDRTEGIEVVWTKLAGAQGGNNAQEG
jgi:hypothetical protein